MRHVLILTAAYGEGHNAAAQGLAEGFRRQEGVSAEVWDPLETVFGPLYRWTRGNYLRTIEHHPGRWQRLYGLLDRTPLIRLASLFLFPVALALRRRIARGRPVAVVSVHPIYAYLLPRRPMVCTVVTDSITVNSVWFRAPSDLYFLPNEESAEVLRRAGVAAARLRVEGFPVQPCFAEREKPREDPASGPFRVLYMINAGGQRAEGVVKELLSLPGLRLTVTVGRNPALQARLQKAISGHEGRAEVLGWVPDMPELIMSHHLLVGKAGGAAVQEAIAAATPMLITEVVPGQEEGNARLLELHACGQVCRTPATVGAQVQRLLAGEAALWREWEGNMRRISRPAAAVQMARAILAAAGERAGE